MSVADQAARGAGIDAQLLEEHDDCLSVLRIVHSNYGVVALSLRLGEFLSGVGCHSLPTRIADRFMAGDVHLAARAGDRREGVRFVDLVDFDAMDAGEFAVCVLTEHRNIPSGHARAPNPSVMVLDVGLVQVSAGEERRARFSEVRGRDGAVNARSLRGLFERLRHHLIGDTIDRVEFRPQWGIPVGAVGGVATKPLVDIRRAGDERDGTPPLLSVNRDLKAVFVVLYVADGEVLELPTTQPGVELEGEHRLVPRVVRGVHHRQDVLFPVEHIARVRRRVVRRGGASGNPFEAIGHLVLVVEALSEHAECRSIVPIGFLVGVRRVDPTDDTLGCLALFERAGEPADAFGHADARPEEFLVSVVGVRLSHQPEAVAEGDEQLTIGVVNLFGGSCALPEFLNLVGQTTHVYVPGNGQYLSAYVPALNLVVQAHPWLNSSGSEPVSAESGRIDSSAIPPESTLGFGAKASGGVAA